MSEDLLQFIPTRSSRLKSQPVDFKACVFREPKFSRPEKPLAAAKAPAAPKQQEEMDMKKARHEIIKFGMSGFDPAKKEEAKINLAIRLGAKPPKNKYKNYKVLQEEKKSAKVVEKNRVELQQIGKNQFGKSNAKGKFTYKQRSKMAGNLLDAYGKPSLKKRELKTLKKR